METIDNALSTVFKNRYSSTLITLFLVLYSGLVAPKLPNFIVKLFDNPIFRILILSLIVYNGNKDPQFAIMIAVGFTVTMNMVSKQKIFEGFTQDETDETGTQDETDETGIPYETDETGTGEETDETGTGEETDDDYEGPGPPDETTVEMDTDEEPT